MTIAGDIAMQLQRSAINVPCCQWRNKEWRLA